MPAPLAQARRILVIQTAFLGDIVLATSFLANLRKLAPEAEIRCLTTPVGAAALNPNELGVKIISYDKRGKDSGFAGFLRTARQLRAFAPGHVFCLHRSLRSVLLSRLSGGTSWGFQEAAGSVLLDHRVVRPRRAYEAEKNHCLLEAWAGSEAKDLPLFPRLGVSAEDEAEAKSMLGELENFIALAPSSVWATKRWPAEKFAELAILLWKRLGLPCVVVGGKDQADLDVARELLEAFSKKAKSGEPVPLNLVGKTGIGSLKSVLSRADLVIANDSAPLHIAIAMGARVVGVFGPTTRDLGFFPLAPSGKAAVAEVSGLGCRPCGLHGHHRCPERHFRCMLDLPPERVAEEAQKLLCR